MSCSTRRPLSRGSTQLSHLAGVDADMDCGSVGLLSLHALNVDDVLFPVDLHNFPNLLAFVMSTDNLFGDNTIKSSMCSLLLHLHLLQTSSNPRLQYLDFIIFSDGHGPHVVLLAELLRQGRRHDLPPDV